VLHPRGGVTVTGAVTRCRPVNFSGSTSTGGVGRSGFHFNSSVFRGFFSFDLCLFVEAWRGGGGVLVDVLVGVNPKPQTSNPKTQAALRVTLPSHPTLKRPRDPAPQRPRVVETHGPTPNEVMKANRFLSQLLDYGPGNTPKVSNWSRNSPLSGLMTNTFGVLVSIIQ